MLHKHKGVERTNGSLRSHPIQRTHKDDKVKKEHNKSLTVQQMKYYSQQLSTSIKKETVNHPSKKDVNKILNIKLTANTVLCNIDKEGYISINLDSCDYKGLKVTFTRDEGRHSKLIALKIDKQPSKRNIEQKVKNRSISSAISEAF